MMIFIHCDVMESRSVKALTRLTAMRVCDDVSAYRAAQMGCYAVGPAVLVLALRGLERMGASRVETLIGVLAAAGVAVGFTAMGTLLGLLAELRRR